MSARFARFHFDPRHSQASIVHPLSAETLAVLPRQDERPTSGGLILHPASSFSPSLASSIAWLARYHLLLRFEPIEIDGCVEESAESEEAEDDSDADSGFSVQLDTLVFQIDLRKKDLWLDAGRAGFILLDGMLYSSFYLDVEELHERPPGRDGSNPCSASYPQTEV